MVRASAIPAIALQNPGCRKRDTGPGSAPEDPTPEVTETGVALGGIYRADRAGLLKRALFSIIAAAQGPQAIAHAKRVELRYFVVRNDSDKLNSCPMNRRIQDVNVRGTEVLIAPRVLKAELPLEEPIVETVVNARETVRRIHHGEDRRLLFLAGPPSPHDPRAPPGGSRGGSAA